MGWKELKLWKKLSILFFFIHLILTLILFNFYYQGEYNVSSLFAISLDLPLLLIGIKFFPNIIENGTFYKLYFPIVGSISYAIMGAVIGLIINKIKKK